MSVSYRCITCHVAKNGPSVKLKFLFSLVAELRLGETVGMFLGNGSIDDSNENNLMFFRYVGGRGPQLLNAIIYGAIIIVSLTADAVRIQFLRINCPLIHLDSITIQHKVSNIVYSNQHVYFVLLLILSPIISK